MTVDTVDTTQTRMVTPIHGGVGTSLDTLRTLPRVVPLPDWRATG